MILSIKNIEKEYDRPVLKNISYSFAAGKLYVIKRRKRLREKYPLKHFGWNRNGFFG